MFILDMKLEGKQQKVLTCHNDRDRQQGIGDIQSEAGAVGKEGIENNSKRLPTANHAERNQSDEEVHRHRSLQVHSEEEKRKEETRDDLEWYLKNQIYEEERVYRVRPVCVFLWRNSVNGQDVQQTTIHHTR